ncbi:LLM class flavin-dependent oxidoreductase [Acinetobacter soli]|uniref:LLM class flavin-dependent oxidoreductase n=1 Tax=Acinetobacter soli TaxID=487316 RepID=UPI00321833D1
MCTSFNSTSHTHHDIAESRKLHLNLFLDGYGHHLASWRHPASQLDLNPYTRYLQAAKIAEKGKFDAIFFADSLAFDPKIAQSGKLRGSEIEPITLLTAIATQTRHIGLIATATTTYNEPYHLARKFASLDQISGGRAGWNLVTTDFALEAKNFSNQEHVKHQDRYARAEEFYDVVQGLWQSWEIDAAIYDKTEGRFFNPDKVHSVNHHGEIFQVKGPLNVGPSPQYHPVIVQAGSSERGKSLAARTADVIFTAQPHFTAARTFYQDVKQRLPHFGRDPQELLVMPGVYVLVAHSEHEAKAQQQLLDDLVDDEIGLGLLGRMLGNFDLSGVDVNRSLASLNLTETQTGQQSRQQLIQTIAQDQDLSIKQLYQRIAAGRGHFCLIGTPEYIADQLEAWFVGGAADGFNIMPAVLANGIQDFVDLVIPILQQRQLFRTEYEGSTLRQNLNLLTAVC